MFRKSFKALSMVAPLAAGIGAGVAAGIGIGAATVVAQEIPPLISPGQAAEGVFLRSRMEAEARRQREADEARAGGPSEAGSIARRKRACDSRPLYRKQYGADHPQMQKLEALCKEAGY